MSNSLFNLMKELIGLGQEFVFLIVTVWLTVSLMNRESIEGPNWGKPDAYINVIKGVLYLFSSWVSYKIYTKTNTKLTVNDLISGIAYILTLLEGTHYMLNTLGNALLYSVLKPRDN